MNNTNLLSASLRLVYLDWNIIISLAEKCLPEFQSILSECIKKRNIMVPFSATHIREADYIADKVKSPIGLAESRLQFLSELTQNTYLYNAGDSYSPSIRNESPEKVRETITEIPFAKEAMNDFINLFDLDIMKQIRRQLELSPNEFNNIKPPNVIDQLDQAVSEKLSSRSPQSPPGFGIRHLLDMVLKLYKNSTGMSIASEMAAVFTAFNSFGFWPDNPKKTNTMAAFFDSMHASDAAHCYYFVSEDKALRLKTMAVYEFFNIKTRVVDIGEFTAILNKKMHNQTINPTGR